MITRMRCSSAWCEWRRRFKHTSSAHNGCAYPQHTYMFGYSKLMIYSRDMLIITAYASKSLAQIHYSKSHTYSHTCARFHTLGVCTLNCVCQVDGNAEYALYVYVRGVYVVYRHLLVSGVQRIHACKLNAFWRSKDEERKPLSRISTGANPARLASQVDRQAPISVWAEIIE